MADRYSLRSRSTARRIGQRTYFVKQTPANSGKLIVLVEGSFDSMFYSMMFDTSKVILTPTGGVDNMDDLIKEYTKNNKEYLAIKDSDFNRFRSSASLPAVFYTDEHDAEMSFFKDSSSAARFEKQLSLDSKVIDYNSAFSELEDYSYYKLGNILYTCYIDFEMIDDAVRTEDIIDYKYVDSYVAKMHNAKPLQLGVFNSLKRTYPYNRHVYSLVNGHDFLNRLCHQIGENKIDEKYMRRVLMKTTCLDTFKTMSLYSAIGQWESKHYTILQK